MFSIEIFFEELLCKSRRTGRLVTGNNRRKLYPGMVNSDEPLHDPSGILCDDTDV